MGQLAHLLILGLGISQTYRAIASFLAKLRELGFERRFEVTPPSQIPVTVFEDKPLEPAIECPLQTQHYSKHNDLPKAKIAS